MTTKKAPFVGAQKVQDINASFTTMRNVALGAIAGLVVVVLVFGYLLYQSNQNSNQKVYVATDLGSFAATASVRQNAFQARNLVQNFMEKMFQHDQYNYKANLSAALPLIEDRGGRYLFDKFERGQILQNYVRYGARQTITIDSIRLNTQARPITGRVYIRQIVMFGDQRSESKPLAAKFKLIDADFSDANAYGMQLADFDFIAYAPVISQAEKQQLRDEEEARKRRLREQAEAAGVPLPQDPGTTPTPNP